MPVEVIPCTSPLIITLPHAATEMPMAVIQRLNDHGQALTDTDWHIDRLFGGLVEGATWVRANFHRYMCNANGNPEALGPRSAGAADAVIPLRDLAGEPIWSQPPDPAEMARWRSAFHAPYHAAIAAQLARVRAQHGHAILIDCHAVHSAPARPYAPELPDLGIGSLNGGSCDHALTAHLAGLCMTATPYRAAIQDRTTEDWTLRRYGRPKMGAHALQINVALSTYLTKEADPWLYDTGKANELRPLLRELLSAAQNWQFDSSVIKV
ncbi:N-formylglutamate amidohydrolase [uncultured Roseobacter sp.]|uniref:N-formylglutamate amidohydrolase n=1 Tax=uncultured Roseobacter sp. TaxID=114847 RepID=UPI00261C6C27|nr:N-formylglutamate amidohydrolase [uncultured Roseobacter sp.]